MAVKIRGSVVLSRKAFVEKNFGGEAWEKIVGSLSPENKKALSGILVHIGWYPFELGKELDQAIVDVLGHGDKQIFEQIGANSAKENLSSVHQSFIRKGDPQAFMRQANQIYRFYYNVGHREYEETGPTSGVMTTFDVETFSEVDCLTVVGWYKEALKMCGAQAVFMVETKCRAKGDDVCQYNVNWRVE